MRSAILLVLCLAAASTATASAESCQSAVNEEIAMFGVTPDQISRTIISRRTRSGDDERIAGYTYWMQLKSCATGNLIVDTNSFCYIQQVYTKRECQVSGVKHY